MRELHNSTKVNTDYVNKRLHPVVIFFGLVFLLILIFTCGNIFAQTFSNSTYSNITGSSNIDLQTIQSKLNEKSINQKVSLEELNSTVQAKSVQEQSDVEKINDTSQTNSLFFKHDATFAQQSLLNNIEQSKTQTGLMIFVSLSMPTVALRQILTDSQTYHIPVVIRGLINNRFPDTTQRIYEILHPEHGEVIQSGVQIDPIYFRQFDIQQVPAVVSYHELIRCTDEANCNKPNFDVVYGNIPLKKALTILAEKGKIAPDVATNALDTVGDNHEAA